MTALQNATRRLRKNWLLLAIADACEDVWMWFADGVVSGFAKSPRMRLTWDANGTTVRLASRRFIPMCRAWKVRVGMPYRVVRLGHSDAYIVLSPESWLTCTPDQQWIYPNSVVAKYAAEASARGVNAPAFGMTGAALAWKAELGRLSDEGTTYTFYLRTSPENVPSGVETVWFNDCGDVVLNGGAPGTSQVILVGELPGILQERLTRQAEPLLTLRRHELDERNAQLAEQLRERRSRLASNPHP